MSILTQRTKTLPTGLDIKELIPCKNFMEVMSLGLNGGLIYCFEYTIKNCTTFYVLRILTEARLLPKNLDFLTEAMDSLTAEYLIILNMHGEIDLYTHTPVVVPALPDISRIRIFALQFSRIKLRRKWGENLAGAIPAMSDMVMLEMRYINVFSEINLAKDIGIDVGRVIL